MTAKYNNEALTGKNSSLAYQREIRFAETDFRQKKRIKAAPELCRDERRRCPR